MRKFICALFSKYYYLKLRWQYKGRQKDFQNYMEFMNKSYLEKMDFSDYEDAALIALKKRLNNVIHSIEFSKNYQTAIEDCRQQSYFVPIPKVAKKTVKQSIDEAIKQHGGLGEWKD